MYVCTFICTYCMEAHQRPLGMESCNAHHADSAASWYLAEKPEGGPARRDISPLTLSSGFSASALSSSFRCSQHFVSLFLFSDRIKNVPTSRSPSRKQKKKGRKKRNIKINCNNSFISSLLIHFSYAWCHT